MTVFGDPAVVIRSDLNSVNSRDTGQGTLSADIDNSQTTITVQSDGDEGDRYVPGQYIKIDNEYMTISSISDNTLTVTRGTFGSTPAVHSDNSNVIGIGVAGNSTLNGSINNSTTSVIVATGTGTNFEPGNMIQIDEEYMLVTGVSSDTLTVTRGQKTSDQDSHDDLAQVTGVFVGTKVSNTKPWVQTSSFSDVNGTLFYQFSNDGKYWSTYPVSGFQKTANIHEFHQAIVGLRFFRSIFKNTTVTKTSIFYLYTYFGVFDNGMLPINQSIGPDQDSVVVRSVGVGQDPDPEVTFSNIRVDGDAFYTTSDIPGTTLVTEMTTSTTGDIEVSDISDFVGYTTDGGSYIIIGDEFISYSGISSGSNTFTIPSDGRGQFLTGTSAYQPGVSVGGVYDSGILSTTGYTQVATKIRSGTNEVEPRFVWYSDSIGTSIVRTISPDYPASNQVIGDYSYLSAPNFSPYTRSLLGNRESSTAQEIFYTMDFTTKAISGQILTVQDDVLPQMTANLHKSITVGKQPDGDYISTPADGLAFETTIPLGYTILHDSLDASEVGNYTVDSTTSLADSGYLNISENNTVDEIIQYSVVDATTINIPVDGRGVLGTSAATHGTSSNLMGVYSSEIAQGKWNDTDGYEILEISLVSDTLSAVNGLRVRFTDNADASQPITRIPVNYTYTQQNVEEKGNLNVRLNTSLDGFSLLYINGISVQSNFYLGATLRIKGNSNLYSGSGSLIVADYSTEVSLGNISNRENVTKFGRNPEVDPTGTPGDFASPADLWGSFGLYTGFPTTAPQTVDVFSDDANDTSAGTGARTIRIFGLASNTSSQYTSEDLTLNGISRVTSQKTWYRVNQAYVLTAGSSGFNEGTITCDRTGVSSVVFFVIGKAVNQGLNQTSVCVYTIPAGITGVIKRVYVSIIIDNGNPGSATVALQTRDTLSDGVFRSISVYDIQTGGNIDDVKNGGIVLPPGTDVRLRVLQVSDTDTFVNGEIEFELITL